MHQQLRLPQNKQCSAHDGMSRRGSCVPDARTLKRGPPKTGS